MESIRVCVVTEDSETFQNCCSLLAHFVPGEFQLEWLADHESALAELRGFAKAVFVVDEVQKDRTQWDFLQSALMYPGAAPIVFLANRCKPCSEVIAEQASIADSELETRAVREGAFDLIFRSDLSPALLAKTIRFASRHSHTIADLATSEERYALAMKGTTDGIWDWNLETDEVFFSSRWKNILGLAENSIGSRPDEWFQRVHPADVLRLKGQLASHLAGHTPHFESEYRVLHHDGTYRWVISRGASVRGREGRAYRLVGSQTDITGRKKVEQEVLHRTVFEMLIRSISTKFINCSASDINEAISESLKSIGEFTGVDCCVVYRFNSAEDAFLAISEWTPEPAPALGPVYQRLPRLQIPHISRMLEVEEDVAVFSAVYLPEEASKDRDFLHRAGIKSFLAVPMSYNKQLLGFLALLNLRQPREWKHQHISLLHILGEIFVNALVRQKSEEELSRIREQEVGIASRIQQSLLLGAIPETLSNAHIAGLTIPSMKVDGDFYDLIQHSPECFDLLIGDVMGKGVPAALLGAATKSQFLRAIIRLIPSCSPGTFPAPETILTSVHNEMTVQLLELESFVTLCYARFDLGRQEITLVNCGHPRILHFAAETGVCSSPNANNMPLGICEHATYSQVVLTFARGDLFLFYSDGITESRNADRQPFGDTRLAKVVEHHAPGHSPEELVEKIRSEVVEFCQDEHFGDDLTCLAVKIKEIEAHRALFKSELEIPSHPEELALARTWIREFWVQVTGLPPEDLECMSILMALNEALANVIKHAYHNRHDKKIMLEAEGFADNIVVRLYHHGDPYIPGSAPPPAFDGSRENGFGLYLIKHSVDEVCFFRDGHGRHTIRLEKRFKPFSKPDSPDPETDPSARAD